jgi:hypothetical protein
LAPAAKFCSECGAAVTQVSRSAEYKQVTVLFADVVHSMDIAAAVGAERLREIMADLLDRSTAVVQRFGGTLSQFTGDGIMAVFGAPVALEDHAVRVGSVRALISSSATSSSSGRSEQLCSGSGAGPSVSASAEHLLSYGQHMGRRRVTECTHGHSYDEANTYVDRCGSQRCRTCQRIRERQRKRNRSSRKTAVCSGCGKAVYPSMKVTADGTRVQHPTQLCLDCRRERRARREAA